MMMRHLAIAALAGLALVACNETPAPKSAEAPASESAAPAAVPPAPVAVATDPAFVGAWAADLASCALEADDPDAPMLITAKGYDQFEAHCDFETVTPAGANEWVVTDRCATAINQDGAFKIKAEGDKLTMWSERGAFTQVRCPKA